MITGVGALAVTGLMIAAPALSVKAANEGRLDGRYQMQTTDDGVLRLDTATGAMSLCKDNDGAWSCARIADDGVSDTAEMKLLRAENRRLKDRIAALERGADTGTRTLGAPKPSSSFGSEGLPSEAEVDRAFSFVEGIIRRFKGLVDDLRREQPDGTPL
ncbi:MAG: hypothetical protein AAFZ01_02270 [Pseudomonadota bacterium]